MKIIVRKMPDMVLDHSFDQLGRLCETCYGGNAMQTFMKSIKMSQDDDCLNMEDDIILCDNFLEEVNKVIEKYPNRLITFFTLKNVDETKEMDGRTFCMNQCVYMPKWFNQMLLSYSDIWLNTKRGKENPTGYDYMMADMMSKLKEKYIIAIPCLVQHMEMKSRINPKRSSKRQTKCFKGDEKYENI